MRCWKCHSSYPEDIKICVKCGINLVTGQPLSSSLGGRPHESAAPEQRSWIADTLPGLLDIKICAVGLSLAAVGYVVLFYSIFMTSIPIIAVSALITAQAIAFLIIGELWLLHTSALEFRGKDWTTLTTLLLVPVAMWIFLLKISYQPGASALEEAKFKIPVLFKPEAPKPPPPPAPSPYVISQLAPPGAKPAGDDDEPLIPIPRQATLFVAQNGDIYIPSRLVLRYSAATGKVEVIAGSGTEIGFGGNGGPATKAIFNGPSSIALDSKGDIYIADTNCIRKINAASGTVDALIGDGGKGPSSQPETGAAREVQLLYPKLVCLDPSDNVYEMDQGPLLRKMDHTTGYVTVIAGKGTDSSLEDIPVATARFKNLEAMCSDPQGNIYLVDDRLIRRIDVKTGIIKTLVQPRTDKQPGSPYITPSFKPHGLACDSNGNVFFGDLYNHRVYKLDPSGVLSIIAGTGKPGHSGDGKEANSAMLNGPRVIGVDGKGVIYLIDGGDRIRKLTPTL